ncbi:MAG: adenylate kinase [Candidatus Thermoplasmatota archaeon]|jgi:adenylate kinase|nr:adenylate kinase [Candidatus Thermoplasmatota archaeon]MCL5794208.1 adenylate kinase [Candidatus Thermoplasmatota archaeon]
MRVVIAGVAGVGKSTVLEYVSKRSQYDVVNYGTLMFEMAKEIGIAKDRDELRKMNVDTQINLQKKASSAIGKMDNVIVDTHMAIKSPRGYLPGLPEWVLRELKISSFFLIEADSPLILYRRRRDKTRNRDTDTLEEIMEHQQVNRAFAVAYSVYTGATVTFVNNPEGKPEEAGEKIARALTGGE